MSQSRSNISAKSEAAAQRKIAAQRAAAKRRQRNTLLAVTGIVVVVAIIAALIIVKAVGGSKPSASTITHTSTQTTAQVIAEATGVPASVLGSVGAGGVASPTKAVTGSPATLTADGKPEVLYMGAEYCPYCAAERWPLVIALSRFGSFSGLGLTASSSTDVYPSTNTFTFLKATYTSQYLDFTSVELQDVNHNTLQTPTAAENALLSQYDVAPYTTSAGSIPFIDFGNKYILSGASYNPQTLQGLTWSQIASDLADASSPVAQAVDGTANRLTAALCKLTGDQPSSVCSSSAITSLQAGL
jgi:Domain of unknown function (DUF929)